MTKTLIPYTFETEGVYIRYVSFFPVVFSSGESGNHFGLFFERFSE